MTIEEILEEIQGKLREDRNNPDLWFQLGQGYFANGEFENANTCFEYVIRLMDEPSSTVYAAKATALYYVSSQRITQEVNQLLELSLSKDQLNDTALTLIANDHFISFRYEEAIATWQRILDSERANIDRVAIINSINRAKALSHQLPQTFNISYRTRELPRKAEHYHLVWLFTIKRCAMPRRTSKQPLRT